MESIQGSSELLRRREGAPLILYNLRTCYIRATNAFRRTTSRKRTPFEPRSKRSGNYPKARR